MQEPETNLQAPESSREEMWETLELYEKWKKIRKFFVTRRIVLDPTFEARLKCGLDKDSVQNPWKFNLTQSLLSSIPALTALWIIDLLYEKPEEPPLYAHILEAAKDILNATTVPITLMIVVMIVRRACLKKQDQSLANRRLAGKLYLYFDGALGLYSQAFAALAFALWSKVGEIPWLRYGWQLQLIALFYWSFVAFYLWQFFITTRNVPRRIFVVLGYSPDIGESNSAEQEAPWGSYRRAVLISVPLILFVVKLLTSRLTDLLPEVTGWLKHTRP